MLLSKLKPLSINLYDIWDKIFNPKIINVDLKDNYGSTFINFEFKDISNFKYTRSFIQMNFTREITMSNLTDLQTVYLMDHPDFERTCNDGIRRFYEGYKDYLESEEFTNKLIPLLQNHEHDWTMISDKIFEPFKISVSASVIKTIFSEVHRHFDQPSPQYTTSIDRSTDMLSVIFQNKEIKIPKSLLYSYYISFNDWGIEYYEYAKFETFMRKQFEFHPGMQFSKLTGAVEVQGEYEMHIKPYIIGCSCEGE